MELSVEGTSSAHVTLSTDGRRVAAAWVASSENGSDVFTSISDDGGRRFGAPVRVNEIPGDAAANGEQPPRAVPKDGAITVVWVSKRNGVSGIRAAQSRDGGEEAERAAARRQEQLAIGGGHLRRIGARYICNDEHPRLVRIVEGRWHAHAQRRRDQVRRTDPLPRRHPGGLASLP